MADIDSTTYGSGAAKTDITRYNGVIGHMEIAVKNAKAMRTHMESLVREIQRLRQVQARNIELLAIVNSTLTDDQLAALPETMRKRLGLREI